jgi:hypothetical protein
VHEHRRAELVGKRELLVGEKFKNAYLCALGRAGHIGIRLKAGKTPFPKRPFDQSRIVFRPRG